MTSAGAKIIQNALSRDLDGEFDRMAAIMLGLLENESTRAVGADMIREVFSRKVVNRNKQEVDYPTSTIALIAQGNFTPNLAEHLWAATPVKLKDKVMGDVLAYALMDARREWTSNTRQEIDKLRELGEFSSKKVSQTCFYVISELWGMYHNDQAEGQQKELWDETFPWLVGGICGSSLRRQQTNDNLFMEKLEWALSYCQKELKLDLAAALELASLDIGQYPRLVETGICAKKQELTRISGCAIQELVLPRM